MSTPIARSVKASFGDDLRRFSFEGNSFSHLEEIVRSIYNLKNEDVLMKYEDDEKDLITIRSDQELDVAFQLSPSGSLKIFVSVNTQQEPSPLYPQVAPNQTVNQIPTQVSPPTDPIILSSPGSCSPKDNWKNFAKSRKINRLDRKYDHLQKRALKFGTARLVQDVTVPDGTIMAPNCEFVKTWRIRNESTAVWQPDFVFVFRKGDCLSNIQSIHLSKVVNPGEEIDISIPMKAPSTFGRYLSVWRLGTCANVKPFGQPFYVRVIVADPNKPVPIICCQDTSFETKINELVAMGFTDRDVNEKILKKCRGDMDRVVWKLLKKQHKLQYKQQKCLYKMEKNRKKVENATC